MRRVWLLLTTIALSMPAAAADIVSIAPEAVQITIYRDPEIDVHLPMDEWDDEPSGLAMVTETRTVEVPEGISTIVFRSVADAIVPQTAVIEGLPAVVLESNFDYDLLSPGAIVAKSLGRNVRLVRTDTATGQVTERHAVLRSGPQGVVLDFDGQLEALNCSGLSEKLVFDSIPDGLAETPTLSMKVRAAQAGRHVVQLSYLALGLNWSADYVATLNDDGRTLNLTGWITLVNNAQTTFANAPTEVVAGELSRTPDETQPPGPAQRSEAARCWPIGSFASRVVDEITGEDISGFPDVLLAAPVMRMGAEEVVVTGIRQSLMAKLSELGDYKLYSLPAPTTVAAQQSKQVQFLSQPKVKYERLYTYRVDVDEVQQEKGAAQRPTATLRLENTKRDGLGKPLPAGTVSVLERARAHTGPVLAGEKALQDTPVGLPMEIELGGAMDVWVEPTVVADETVRPGRTQGERQAKIEVRFGNDKPIPILIEYRHPADGGARIVAESKRHTMKQGDPMWSFRLKPGERSSLQYTVRHAY